MSNNEYIFPEAPGLFLRAASLGLFGLSFAAFLLGQTPAPPAPSPAVQPVAPLVQTETEAKPSPPAKTKKVITNEDLEPRTAAGRQTGATGKIITGDASSLLNCDTACEQQARELLGYGSDYEAEWRMQVVRARRDLIVDGEWRAMLSQSLDQVRTYCNFLAQESQKIAPSGNSYNAQVQRAQNRQYFESMGNGLRQGLQTTVNRMESRMKEVGARSPVRAAMMNVEANRIFDRTCEQPPQR